MQLPQNALFCIRRLQAAGFPCYAVGGCVRDALLGLTPHDFDLCTAAHPAQIKDIFADFPQIHAGEKHGTIGIIFPQSEVYEITTFRTEGGYADSRHPDWVNFVPNIEQDLARRDFTVNAMAYAPDVGFIDPFGGQADLKNRTLRAVGDAKTRFSEDALRILRGVRFSATYGLIPEGKTKAAMIQLAPLMENLARERVFDELCKLLPLVTAQDLLHYVPVLIAVIPELAPMVGFQQHNPYHAYDVFTHTAQVVESCPPVLSLRWAALLHDAGKPSCFTLDENGRGHFYGHAQTSARMADDILHRLRAPTALREQVVALVDKHMTPLTPDRHVLRRRLGRYGEETVRQLLALQQADFGSKGTEYARQTAVFQEIDHLLTDILAEADCLTVKDLAVNGHDLIALGLSGPEIGRCLADLLTQVQEDALLNEKAALLSAAQNR